MPNHKIPVQLNEGPPTTAFVWDVDDAERLRRDHGVVGSLCSTLPHQPSQSQILGLPLMLSLEEVHSLQRQGVIEVMSCVDGDVVQPLSDADNARSKVFHEYRERGFSITPGVKFGGDYLLYPGDPAQYHASHILTITEKGRRTSFASLASKCRLANNVKKKSLICYWDAKEEGAVELEIDWTGW
ncbi:hypothetical protein HK101_006019 [Irineochytrium annulatum]|nr:hypothetical protein HK101_006019 [Irineochytrium annulatum]